MFCSAPEGAAPVIAVHDLSKRYQLYDQPMDRLKQSLFWRLGRNFSRTFWALRSLSFEVQRGEAVGIIGRNGSGKSTLLQLIAGTLTPTTGTVQVQGRVAALLELGSGFNPEFTGRENVYLNGAILGLTRDEMAERFDAIASFADIGPFLDQPVKVYSSGMVVRLAFAVQAHVQADVLIVDEALSVGDVYFQHKCMRHIKRLLDGGTTLLLVSHATDTIKRFCQRGLWLDSGELRYQGSAGAAVEKYLAHMRMQTAADTPADAGDTATQNDALPAGAGDGMGEPGRPASLGPQGFEFQLAPVEHIVDLGDQRLFLRGNWTWAVAEGQPLPVRVAREATALAGFRCSGSQLELRFWRGPGAGNASVWVDGRERRLELFNPAASRLETLRLALAAGEHTILIAPDPAAGGRSGQLYWLGGAVSAPRPLAFRRDPAIAAQIGEVERYGNGKARFAAVELLDYATERPLSEASFGQRVRLRLHAERLAPAGPRLEFSFIVRDQNRVDLFGTTSIDEGLRLDPAAAEFVVEFAFDIRLKQGSYSILVGFVECSEDLSLRVPMEQIDIARVFTVSFDPLRPVWYAFHEPVEIAASVTAAVEVSEPV